MIIMAHSTFLLSLSLRLIYPHPSERELSPCREEGAETTTLLAFTQCANDKQYTTRQRGEGTKRDTSFVWHFSALALTSNDVMMNKCETHTKGTMIKVYKFFNVWNADGYMSINILPACLTSSHPHTHSHSSYSLVWQVIKKVITRNSQRARIEVSTYLHIA
jgi:hypothetical protein